MHRVYLTFKPVVTRRYTGTLLDMMPGTDMFVPYGSLYAVSYGEEAATMVGQQLIEELRNGCRFFSEDAVPEVELLTREMRVYRRGMKMAWNEAIRVVEEPIVDLGDSNSVPELVTVVLEEHQVKPWGQPHKPVKTVRTVGVFADSVDAQKASVDRTDLSGRTCLKVTLNVQRSATAAAA